jgi:hypothetical protein
VSQPLGLLDAYGYVLDKLEAAGIRWNIDLQNMIVPGVLVPVPELTFRYSRSTLDARFTVVAVVNNTNRRAAVEELSELVTLVQSALDGAITELRPVEVTTTDSTGSLLAAELPITVSLKGTP